MEAVFNKDKTHRLYFEAETNLTDKRMVCFILLNPTAIKAGGNATIHACKRFANHWGFGKFCIVNLYSILEPNPKMILQHPHPIHPENTGYIQRAALRADLIIAAWGNHPMAWDAATKQLPESSNLKCVGINKSGNPRHPLRLSLRPYGEFTMPHSA